MSACSVVVRLRSRNGTRIHADAHGYPLSRITRINEWLECSPTAMRLVSSVPFVLRTAQSAMHHRVWPLTISISSSVSSYNWQEICSRGRSVASMRASSGTRTQKYILRGPSSLTHPESAASRLGRKSSTASLSWLPCSRSALSITLMATSLCSFLKLIMPCSSS